MIRMNLIDVVALVLIVALCIFSVDCSAKEPSCNDEFARICYFTSWSVYREGKSKFQPSDISPEICSVVVYSFAFLDDSLDKIKASDEELDFTKGFYKEVTALREQSVDVVLALGGWNESTDKYSKMLADPTHRTNVVRQATSFIADNNFIGLDLDLEYPNAWQGVVGSGSTDDKANFLLFVKELRTAFDEAYKGGKFSKRPSLSVAVSGNEKIVDVAYDVPGLAEVVTWIGVMAYDMHSNAESQTGLNSPFEMQPGDEGIYKKFNVKNMMELWLSKGAPANKLVLGIPLYGKTFVLKNLEDNGINAPAEGKPDSGEFTKSDNTLAFYEIVDNVLVKDWTPAHVENVGSYAYGKNKNWVGYDDTYDVAVKANYIRQNCFYGAMIWALDYDCFQDTTCPGISAYPLLTTLKEVLAGEVTYRDVENIT